MPLNPTALVQAILTRTDPDNPAFLGFPASTAEAGAAWAQIASAYFREAVAPPLSAVTGVGEPAFVSTFVGANGPGTGLIALSSAFIAYASAVAPAVSGIVPGSLSTPPASPLTVTLPAALIAQGNVPDATIAATTMAGVIDTWARTGVFIPNLATGGGVPWS